MNNKGHYYFVVALIGIAYLLTGCVTTRLDKTAEQEMRTALEVPPDYGAGKLPTEGR